LARQGGQSRFGSVHDMNQIEISLADREGASFPQFLQIGNAAGAVNPGKPQAIRAARNGRIGDELLRRQAGLAARANRLTFRLFVDPFAGGLAIHSRRADIDESSYRIGQSQKDVGQTLLVNLVNRMAGAAIEANRVQDPLDFRKLVESLRSHDVRQHRFQTDPSELVGMRLAASERPNRSDRFQVPHRHSFAEIATTDDEQSCTGRIGPRRFLDLTFHWFLQPTTPLMRYPVPGWLRGPMTAPKPVLSVGNRWRKVLAGRTALESHGGLRYKPATGRLLYRLFLRMRDSVMKLRALVLGSWLVWWGAWGHSPAFAEPSRGEETGRFPYDAYVVTTQALIRSGPGEDYYVTSRLPQGTKVKVYKEAAGGWLAIEPPPDSFCWVSGERLWRTSHADIGEVVGTGAVAWIGSVVEEISEHRWQVELNPGEQLTLLGEKLVARIDGPGDSLWYRVAPPSGEFRWVRDIEVLRRKTTAAETSPDRPPRGDDATGLRDPLVRRSAWTGDERRENEKAPSDLRAGRRNPPSPAASSAAPDGGPRVASLAPREPDRFRDLDGPPRTGPPLSSSATRDEIVRVEAEMALMVAKPPGNWDFTVLRERLQKAIDQGATPLDRGRARLVMERLEAFENLRKRQVQLDRGIVERSGAASERPGSASERSPPQATGTVPASEHSPKLEKMNFAATGRLVPAHSQDPKAPKFALVDASGKAAYLIVPSPGVNLRRYEKLQVGIRGKRGADYRPRRDPENLLPVLVADNVINLERR